MLFFLLKIPVLLVLFIVSNDFGILAGLFFIMFLWEEKEGEKPFTNRIDS